MKGCDCIDLLRSSVGPSVISRFPTVVFCDAAATMKKIVSAERKLFIDGEQREDEEQ